MIRFTVMYLNKKYSLTTKYTSIYKDKTTPDNGVVSLDRTSLLLIYRTLYLYLFLIKSEIKIPFIFNPVMSQSVISTFDKSQFLNCPLERLQL